MKPFDDMLPEEQEDKQKELIELIQGARHLLPDISATQDQAIARVQQRLFAQFEHSEFQQAGVLMQSTENEQADPPRSLSILSASSSKAVSQRRRRNRFILNLLAAVLVVCVLASAFLLLSGRLLQSKTAGREQWSFQMEMGASWPLSPTVANGMVYANSSGWLYGVDATSGSQKWVFHISGTILASPEVAHGLVYVGENGALGQVHALNALSGREQWSFQKHEDITALQVVDSIVYINTGDSPDGTLYALDAVSGKQKWSLHTAGKIFSSLTVVNGLLYANTYTSSATTDVENHTFYALDASTGHEKWHWAYPTTPPGASIHAYNPTGVEPSPVIVNGIIYLGTNEGSFYALDAVSGHEKWHWAYPANFIDPTTLFSNALAPAVMNNVVYLASDNGSLYALNVVSGSELWSFQAKGPIISTPIVVNGTIYLSSHDTNLYALNAITGRELWSFQMPYEFFSSTVANGMIYINCMGDDKLYALHTSS